MAYSLILVFAKIPEGGNPFPVEYDIASMQFDDVVIEVRLQAVDLETNAHATAEVVLSQEDVVPPDLYLRGGLEITVEMGLPFDDPGFIATDDEGGDLGHLVVVSGFVDTDKEGGHILKYNVSDTAGNVASELERKVSVVFIDRKAPVIVLKGDVLLSLLVGDSFTDPEPLQRTRLMVTFLARLVSLALMKSLLILRGIFGQIQMPPDAVLVIMCCRSHAPLSSNNLSCPKSVSQISPILEALLI